MFLAEMLKRLLQQNLHICDITRPPGMSAFGGESRRAAIIG